MRLLALFTGSEPASVALVVESRFSARTLERGGAAARLVPAAQALLDEARLEPRDLDGIAFAAGPGSFTGLRVGASTALGLGRASAVPLFAPGTLDVWAHAVRSAARAPRDGSFWVVLDARRCEVYAARYDAADVGVGAEGPFVLATREAVERLERDGAPVAGDAADRVAPGRELRLDREIPMALQLARLVAAAPGRWRHRAGGAALDYLRQPQAVARRTPPSDEAARLP